VTSGRHERLLRCLRRLALPAAAAGLAFALWAERHGVADFPWRVSWFPFALAVLAFAAGPVVGATSFWLIVRALTGRTAFLPCAHVWMRSFLARYVPSGALTVAVRLDARGRIGASRGQILLATVYEQVAAALGGASAATVALLLTRRQPPPLAAALVVSLGAALAAAPAAISRLRRVPLPQARPVRVPRRALTAAALLDCSGWFLTGGAAWTLVDALSTRTESVAFVTGAYALAWLAGFVIVFAPSGLGVREATLVALLAPGFGTGPATALALILRFANIVGDLVALALVEVAWLVAPRADRTAAGSGSLVERRRARALV
jgi:hypothetical protein